MSEGMDSGAAPAGGAAGGAGGGLSGATGGDNSYSNVMRNLGNVARSLSSEHRSEQRRERDEDDGEQGRTQRRRARERDEDDGEDTRERRLHSPRTPKGEEEAKPKPKPKPKPQRAPEPEPQADDDDDEDYDFYGESDDDSDEGEGQETKAEAELRRKLQRYGKEVELDLSDRDAALEQLLRMASDDDEVTLSIDGEEWAVKQGDLPMLAQKSAASHKRFAQAKEMYEQARRLHSDLRSNPLGVLYEVGVDPVQDPAQLHDVIRALTGGSDPQEWIVEQANQMLDEWRMGNDPNAPNYDPRAYAKTLAEREKRALEGMERLKGTRAQRAQQEQQQRAQQEQYKQAVGQFAQRVASEYERHGLQQSQLTDMVSWQIFQEARNAGLNPTPEDVARETRLWLDENAYGQVGKLPPERVRKYAGDDNIRSILTGMDDDALVDFLGKDTMRRLAKHSSKRARAKAAGRERNGRTAHPEREARGRSSDGGPMTATQANKLLKAGKLF